MVYIACLDMNMDWMLQELAAFERMWREGVSIYDIARELNRDVDEVAILIIDRSRKGKIDPRPGGALGYKHYQSDELNQEAIGT